MEINRCLYILLIVLFISCNRNNTPDDKPEIINETGNEKSNSPKADSAIVYFNANITTDIGRNINCIFQDKNDNYWFATNGQGVYRYDGKILLQFTSKDGLLNDYVGTIQEDKSGNIWFSTAYGISRFDGRNFTSFTTKDSLPLKVLSDNDWKKVSTTTGTDDLWFNAGGGAYRYDGKTFSYLPLPKTDFDNKYSQGPSDRLSAYGVYCMLKDRSGNMWFGTQSMGVCRFDGKSFTWFTEKGLSPPAVRGIFEDKKGNLWFGNNGAGLFRYDVTRANSLCNMNTCKHDLKNQHDLIEHKNEIDRYLINFTVEKGLINDDFWSTSKISGKSKPGTLARVWTINEDNSGNLWIGTTDAGVWHYDGKNLINYTTINGLTSNAINTIYKDKKGELWFGTEGGGVCKFNGTSFIRVVFN
jgi:ligand-binding sensor domain-containing protein